MAPLTLAEHQAHLTELRSAVAQIDREYDGKPFPAEVRSQWNELNEQVETEEGVVRELQARHDRVAELAGNPDNIEDGTFHDTTTYHRMPEHNDGVALARGQSMLEWGRNRRVPGFDRDDDLSFGKILRGLAIGEWDGAQAEQRAISESPTSAGGFMVPTPLAADVIDKARNQARVFEAGATLVPMTSATLKYARLTTEPTPAWRNEAAAVSDSALVFDSVVLTAQSMALMVKCSIELFEDAASTPGVIENSFAAGIALELDRVALRGSGTPPEPKGVLNQSGITTTAHGANGSVIGSPPAAGTMGWEFLVTAAGAVRGNNFGPTAQIMAPRTDQSLGLLRDTTNQYISPPKYLDNVPRLTTKQVPINLTVGSSSDCSEVYTGDWSQMLIGIRTGFNLRRLDERFADNLQVAFLCYLRGDIQLAQPGAFNVDTGVRS